MSRSISHLLAALVFACAAIISTYAQTTPNCPTVTVTGPAGVTIPGESFHFTATIDKAVPNAIAYRWTVSTGTIAEGQGTDRIKVDVDWETVGGISLTATVEVLGLPKECPNTASETAGVVVCPATILVDEYSTQVGRVEGSRLAAFAIEMNKYPNSFGISSNISAREPGKPRSIENWR